jgi:hypothetical protein
LTVGDSKVNIVAGVGEKSSAPLDVRVVGLLNIADDVRPDLARHTIQRLKLHGVLRAREEVKEALVERMNNGPASENHERKEITNVR